MVVLVHITLVIHTVYPNLRMAVEKKTPFVLTRLIQVIFTGVQIQYVRYLNHVNSLFATSMQAGIPSCFFRVGMDGIINTHNGVLWAPEGGCYLSSPKSSVTAVYSPSESAMDVPSFAFDNSRVSPIYGRSDSVVPNSRTCKFFIRYL